VARERANTGQPKPLSGSKSFSTENSEFPIQKSGSDWGLKRLEASFTCQNSSRPTRR
jgi:hypothetical protein